MTSKGYHPSSLWTRFGSTIHRFSDLHEAKQRLKEEYGKCKRVPMYIDIGKEIRKVGYIYSFRNNDISHTPVQRWIQQDWVEFWTLQYCEEGNI